MKPQVTFADAETLMIDYLTTAFAGRDETYAPATISPDFPTGTLTGATHVQVELEQGNADDYPIAERNQVRVTCYAPKAGRTDVKALASLAQALAYSHPGDGDVAGVVITLGRSNVITDPDTKNLMCWFLVRVNLKATLLAS